ncbi:hypothetical protein X971_4837 (plasmid) [Agrobacterium tumefaciens LBA4213 (Ach5)]|nr:hypothetical protein X971_4837 [Agrobacterium tumefaciens LBA4213 (Ach5)]
MIFHDRVFVDPKNLASLISVVNRTTHLASRNSHAGKPVQCVVEWVESGIPAGGPASHVRWPNCGRASFWT